MLLLQGRAETKTLNFFLKTSVPEGWGRNIGKMLTPALHKKKPFLLNFFSFCPFLVFVFGKHTHSHTHTHTHTATHTHTHSHTHTHKTVAVSSSSVSSSSEKL